MLSDRRQRVLAALIEEYVARALPVGSRTLTERYKLGVSPATVRNELSILEDEGYIAQPHTSAGRIPTDFGYRTFVDDLLANDSLPDEERYRAVAEDLRKSASELDSLLEQTSSALARLSDPLVRAVLDEVLSCIQEGQTGRTHQLGMSALLAQPEFSHTDAVLPLVQVLEDDTVLLHILDDLTSTDEDLSVQIGKENKTEGLSGVSVVASRYGRGEAEGVVAVIGPTRMEDSKVIQAVRAASAALGES